MSPIARRYECLDETDAVEVVAQGMLSFRGESMGLMDSSNCVCVCRHIPVLPQHARSSAVRALLFPRATLADQKGSRAVFHPNRLGIACVTAAGAGISVILLQEHARGFLARFKQTWLVQQ